MYNEGLEADTMQKDSIQPIKKKWWHSFSPWCIVTFLCILISISSFMATAGFADDTDPDGFRGIRWGASINDIPGMMPCRPCKLWRQELGRQGLWGNGPNFPQEIKTYLRIGDRMTIGQIPLNRIEYVFWRGRFIGVAILYNESYDDYMGSYLNKVFGNRFNDTFYKTCVCGPYIDHVCLWSGQFKRERYNQMEDQEALYTKQLRQQF